MESHEEMTGPGKVINPHPDDNPERRLLNVKYKVFLEQCYSQRNSEIWLIKLN